MNFKIKYSLKSGDILCFTSGKPFMTFDGRYTTTGIDGKPVALFQSSEIAFIKTESTWWMVWGTNRGKTKCRPTYQISKANIGVASWLDEELMKS